MDDMYKYPVFFECPSLQLDQQRKTKNYFQTRRRSGGGDCGPLKRVVDNIYSVAFQDQKDQQRVLEKSEHEVDGLVFTVHDSQESCFFFQDGLDSVLIQDFSNAVQPEQAVHQQEHELTPKRIVILGKTGYGKSSLANTILPLPLFNVNPSSRCVMSHCQAKTGSVHGRNVTVIDTPGLFDTERSEEDVKSDIVKCITECAPGPHAFLIVLKVERFTKQEEDVIDEILKCFSEEALKYSVIVFTHGDQLEGQTIEEFVSENKKLSDLVKKCGDRCHVFDSKYWKNNEGDNYRNNSVQVKKLLNTIDKIVMENKGGYYTNEMLQVTNSLIEKAAQCISKVFRNLTQEENIALAKAYVNKFLIRMSGVATGAVLGALLGLPAMVGLMITAINNTVVMIKCLREKELEKAAAEAARKAVAAVTATATATAAIAGGGIGGAATATGGAAAAAAAATGGAAAAAATGGAAAAAAVATGGGGAAVVVITGGGAAAVATGEAAAAAAATAAAETAAATAAAAATGEAAAGAAVGASAAIGAGIAVAALVATAGVVGGVIGYKASEKAETPSEAAKMAAKEVCEKVKSTFKLSTKHQQLGYQPLPDDD